MYQELLDHWWVANIVPYFVFNVWLVHSYERDEGPIEGVFWRILFYWFGLLIVVGFAAWIVYDTIHEKLERMEMNAFKPNIGWRRRWLPLFKKAGRHFLEITIVGMAYLLFMSTVGYHPQRWEFYIEVLLMWFAIRFCFYRVKLHSNRSRYDTSSSN